MKCRQDRIVIWYGWLMLIFVAVPVGMMIVVLKQIPKITVRSAGSKALLICFFAAWFGILISVVCRALRLCQTVTIDLRGVRSRRLFSTLELSWSEIGDWGVVAEGRQRGVKPKAGSLYFSREPVEKTTFGKRRYRGDVIRVMLFDMDDSRVWQQIVPLCQSRSMVKPQFAG